MLWRKVGRQKKAKNSCVQSYDFLTSILSRSENGRFQPSLPEKGLNNPEMRQSPK